MKPVTCMRKAFEHAGRVEGPPSAVFPLLCPVREYDWIEDWRCEVLHTRSGVAEDGCVFRTESPAPGGTMTWVVSRYEPSARIEFACVDPEALVMRLRITLQPEGEGTRLVWRREYTATAPRGEAWLETVTEAQQVARTENLFALLSHYLRHGTMRRSRTA